MRRWEGTAEADEGELTSCWPGNTPEQLARGGIQVGETGSNPQFRLTA